MVRVAAVRRVHSLRTEAVWLLRMQQSGRSSLHTHAHTQSPYHLAGAADRRVLARWLLHYTNRLTLTAPRGFGHAAATAREKRRHCDENDSCSTKRKILAKVHMNIPIDGVNNPNQLNGVRVRCAVPGNVG